MTSARIKVRGQNGQTREVAVEAVIEADKYGKPRLAHESQRRLSRLHVGDLISFKENPELNGLQKMRDSTVRLIRKNHETQFLQIRRAYVDFE